MGTATQKPCLALCMEYSVVQAGGVEVLVVELVKGLASEFDIILVSDDDRESLSAAGLTPLVKGHLRWRLGQGDRTEARALARNLKHAGVGLAHFHFGGTWCWNSRLAWRCPILHTARLGIPVVATNHLVHPPMEGFCGAHRPWWQKLALFGICWSSRLAVLRATRHEITVSRADRDTARKLFWPLRHRIDCIYHSRLDETNASEIVPADQRAPVILSLGTIGPRKGQKVLAEAFSRIVAEFPNWRLRIVGRIADPSYFQSIRLGPRVDITGYLPDKNIRRELDQAAIFAMPSLSEGLGLSLQEALFRGCACIGSRVGGIPELIEHGHTGLLVPPNDSRALADGLRALMRDRILRARLGENGRAHILAKGMTRQRMVRRHSELYWRILTRR